MALRALDVVHAIYVCAKYVRLTSLLEIIA